MKTVIVTGASRGIGAAICRSLRVQGVRVVGVARSADNLKHMAMEKIGTGPFEYVVGDVGDQQTLQSVVQLASRDDGDLVGLVLNAATLDPFNRVKDIDADMLSTHYRVNVWSQQVLTKLCLPQLRETQGKIVFVTSGIVDYPMVGWSAYAASKAAMNAFIKCLAKEEPLVTSVAVKPGIVDTDMVKQSSTAQGVMDAQGEQWLKSVKSGQGLLDPEVPGEAIAKIVLTAPKSASGGVFNYNDSKLG